MRGDLAAICPVDISLTSTCQKGSDAHVTFVRVENPDVINNTVHKSVVSLCFHFASEGFADLRTAHLQIYAPIIMQTTGLKKGLHYNLQAEVDGRL